MNKETLDVLFSYAQLNQKNLYNVFHIFCQELEFRHSLSNLTRRGFTRPSHIVHLMEQGQVYLAQFIALIMKLKH